MTFKKFKRTFLIESSFLLLLTVCFFIVLFVLHLKTQKTDAIDYYFSRLNKSVQYAASQSNMLAIYNYNSEISKTQIDNVISDLLSSKQEVSDYISLLNEGYVSDYKKRYKLKFDSATDQTLNNINETWQSITENIDIIISSEYNNRLSVLMQLNSDFNKLFDRTTYLGMELINKNGIRPIYTFRLLGILISSALLGIMSLYRLYKKTTAELARTPNVTESNQKTEGLISLIENLNHNSSFSEALEFIFKSFAPFVPYNYIGVALVKDNGSKLEASFGISDGSITGLPEGLMNKQYSLKGSSLDKILKTGTVRVINDLELYVKDKPEKEYNNIILKSGIRSSISLPLSVSDKHIGIIFFSSRNKYIYNDEHVEFLKAIANSIAISFDKNIFVNNLLYSSLLALAKLAEARDEDTGDHLFRIGSYCELICRLLQKNSKYKDVITPEYIFNIKRFSPMHDIGKVGVRDAILLKPGKLTKDEFEEMKQHTIYGATVLRAAEDNISKSGKSLFALGIEIAESHHEKWDGSGYPYGKKGEEIPLSARIVAVADVFDALTSKRPYKEPFSFDESLQIIIDGSGTHFDPEIVGVLNQNKNRLFELYNNLKTPV